MDVFNQVAKYLRERRVGRRESSVLTAMFRRECGVLIKYANGTASPNKEYLKDKHFRIYTALQDSYRQLGLPAGSVERLLRSVSYEVQAFKLEGDNTLDYIDDAVTEEIRTEFVEKGIISADQFIEGINAKWQEVTA